MHLIVYISDYSGEQSAIDQVLKDIATTAKRDNPALGITGVLFYSNGKFIQVIEGLKSDLDTLMIAIEADKRHTNIHYLVNEPINKRCFEDWNMDTFNIDKTTTLDHAMLGKVHAQYRQLMSLSTDTLVLAYKTMIEAGVFTESRPG